MHVTVNLASAAECVAFERESFGALHQMLSNLPNEADRQEVWADIEQALRPFETPTGFAGPCELVLGVGVK